MKTMILVSFVLANNFSHAFVSNGDGGAAIVTSGEAGSGSGQGGSVSGSRDFLTTRPDLQLLQEAKVDVIEYKKSGYVSPLLAEAMAIIIEAYAAQGKQVTAQEAVEAILKIQ